MMRSAPVRTRVDAPYERAQEEEGGQGEAEGFKEAFGGCAGVGVVEMIGCGGLVGRWWWWWEGSGRWGGGAAGFELGDVECGGGGGVWEDHCL